MNTRLPTLDPLLRPRVLAGLLRSSRLALVYGEADRGRTALLKSGMLPLLRRRSTDLAASLGFAMPSPARSPDRRAVFIGPGAASGAELVIVVDDWSTAPLAQVLQRLQLALPAPIAASIAEVPRLADALAIAAAQLRVRFLFIFDRFEDHLTSAGERRARDEFAEDIISVVNDPVLPAHFLLAVRPQDEPLLGHFQSRIKGFGDHFLRLPQRRAAEPAPANDGQPKPAVEPTTTAPAAASGARTADIYRSIETTLARIAAESAPRLPWQPPPAQARGQAGARPPTPASDPAPSRAPAGLAPARAPTHAPAAAPAAALAAAPAPEAAPTAAAEVTRGAGATVAAATIAAAASDAAATAELDAPAAKSPARHARRARRQPPLMRLWPAAALATGLAMVAAAYPLWTGAPRPAPDPMAQAPARPAAADSVAASTRPARQVGVATLPPVPGGSVARPAAHAKPAVPAFAGELATLLGTANRGDIPVDPNNDWSAALAFKAGAPRLVVAHYDALQAARADPATPRLHIVAPLVLDEVLFVARADAPLNFIHQIAGRRLQAGPAEGARALTASTVYQRLFGAVPPARATAAAPATAPLSADAALQRLADSSGSGSGDGDVVVVVGAGALDAWASAHPDAMRRLKLLGLDRRNTASRQALQAYLPVTLRAAEHRSWLAQDTTTLAVMSFVVTPASATAADAAAVEQFARRLCERLPSLQRSGDPKWREVDPGLEVPALWPYSPTAARAFAACAAPAAAAAASRSTQLPGARS